MYTTVYYCILMYTNVYYGRLLYTNVYYCILLYTTVYYCRLLRITVLIASPSLYASWEGRAAMTVCRMTGSSCPVRSRLSRGEGAVVESVRVCVWRGTYSFYSYRRPCHGAYHGWPWGKPQTLCTLHSWTPQADGPLLLPPSYVPSSSLVLLPFLPSPMTLGVHPECRNWWRCSWRRRDCEQQMLQTTDSLWLLW